MSEAPKWCLIESDPGLFTDLIHQFGVTGAQVEELWTLDDESFAKIKPVLGLIFLFKYQNGEKPTGNVVKDGRLDNIFFAQQMIANACATQAILSILMNKKKTEINLGPTLTEFKEFTQSFDSHLTGLTLTNSDTIRNVHNSFARQTLFEFGEKKPGDKEEDSFHFVSYVPIDDRLYELDGLQEGPIDHGKISNPDDWIASVQPVIQDRINKYSAGEVYFNLMAVVADRKVVLEENIAEIQQDIEENGMSTTEQSEELVRLQTTLEDEMTKRQQWCNENIRRKHNYLPLIVNMLKILAEQDHLMPMYKKAVEKTKERMAKDEARSKKSTK